MVKEPLEKILSGFPTEEHVKNVCKPGSGSKTCRYLTMSMSSGRWDCAKYGSLRRTLDERVANNTINAKGDNCGGLLGIILENQKEKVGKRIKWEERSPTYKEVGAFQRMEVKDNMLYVTALWDERGEDSISFNLDYLDIRVAPLSVKLSLAGLGMFGGEATLYL